ncbi:hypothetical protein [Adhaeribacter arboris]|uniref:hypothetical protein n=1 Tax=Adhaeribacter arboris TaxID=2072846 RepID=UPI001304F60F|nr:hypothetical protein [Adhaeribacter arboris]
MNAHLGALKKCQSLSSREKGAFIGKFWLLIDGWSRIEEINNSLGASIKWLKE